MARWARIASAPTHEVSEDGQVRGLARAMVRSDGSTLTVPSRLLSVSRDGDGYRYVHLPFGRAYVSVLILENFVGPRPFPGAMARHLDDNRNHDYLPNLAWGTAAQNVADSVRNGTHNMARKTHCPRNHEYSEENTLIVVRNGCEERICRKCKRLRERQARRRRTL